MATYCSILLWEIPWTEEPGGLQSSGSRRVRHDWSGSAHTRAQGDADYLVHLGRGVGVLGF